MDDGGFTKRIIVYDFFSENNKKSVKEINLHHWAVGIWIDYQKQLVALRLDHICWDEIVLPFDKIQSVEIIVDGATVATEGLLGGIRTNDVCNAYQVRIVAGDISSGTKAYILKLWAPNRSGIYGGLYYPNNQNCRAAIQECAKSIQDEINNIFLYVGR